MSGPSFLDRFRKGLERTRDILNADVMDLARGQRPLEPKDLDAVEEALIAADLGMPAVQEAMDVLRRRSGQIWTEGPEAMRAVLKEEIRKSLAAAPEARSFATRPWVVFVVGVNGVGKTTTIAKLAQTWKAEGRTTLLCAADTFRAAAAEQLEIWARRTGSPFHRGAEGADPSAVLTDGLRAARSRGYDAVLVDTAGRLHTKGNLMNELAKMARVAGREVPGAPHETLLVLDATVGSNGLVQGREFARAAGVTGLVLAKLDGTAKGGVAVAVVRELGVPIRYVGVGEALGDLLPFDAEAFAEGLLG
ncbi:MAG: signal recognition particle-docking protein FtsY [Acidobacteria bacterium]|nr:MAG: signal recognition particle-docking protein FtsY [Acidobacteriota bacterium]PYQ23501.1 MAG: signal recognition particle-docking protein FtsY [Acidobacteriota bacterium]